MFWFKKKPKAEAEEKEDDSEKSDDKPSGVSANVEIELTKIKSSLEALNEVRKANAEQFTRLSEQIGELRGAIMDSNKAISVIEVASTKAVDMVTSVQPDKLMIEVRKTDGKTEALRANIEANEAMMRDIMKEIKTMREQMNFYKGVDQVIKMNNEVKQELLDIKKTEGLVGKHADRVETIFLEVEKKFYDFEKFNQAVKELDVSFKKTSSDFDKMRVTLEEKADKKEFIKLADKFSDFEKHTSNILRLLDQKSKNTAFELNGLFTQLKQQLEKKYDKKLDVKELNVDDSTAKDASKDGASTVSLVAGEKQADVASGVDSDKKDVDTKTESSSADSKNAKKGLFGLFKKGT